MFTIINIKYCPYSHEYCHKSCHLIIIFIIIIIIIIIIITRFYKLREHYNVYIYIFKKIKRVKKLQPNELIWSVRVLIINTLDVLCSIVNQSTLGAPSYLARRGSIDVKHNNNNNNNNINTLGENWLKPCNSDRYRT